MADNTLKTRLLSAYNTTAFWSTCTIVPLSGEVCYGVDDNNKILEIKIGNGVDTYAQLPAQSFDNEDHLYKLATPVSTTTAVDKFTATTYLQVNDGAGGSSYSNSSSAVLTIPTATATAAGLLSKDDKVKLNGIATGANKVEVVEGTTNGTIKVTTNGTASTVKVHGLDSAAYTSSASYLTDIAKSGNSITKTKGGSTSTVVTFGDAAFKSTTGSITSGSALPTEGAVKTYVDALVANATHFCGGFTASGDGTIDGQTGKTLKTEAEKVGDMYTVTTAGTYLGIAFEVGDSIIFQKAVAAGTAPTTADFITVEGETSVSVIDNNPTLAWSTRSTVGTVEGTALTVTMPANPDKHTYLTSSNFTNTPASASVKLGIQTSGTSAAKAETTIPGATTGAAGVMTTAQVATLNKVVSATTAVEGLTKKPSGTAPISVDANNVITHDNSGVTAGTYGSSSLVPIITVDAKGHVTSATTATVKDTTYSASASDRVALSGTTFYHTTAITAGKTVANTASTADAWGESVSFSVPEISYDKWGHTTAVTSKAFKVKIPADPSYTLGATIKSTSPEIDSIKLFRSGTLVSSVTAISTDLLRNGNNTLILDGNFTS